MAKFFSDVVFDMDSYVPMIERAFKNIAFIGLLIVCYFIVSYVAHFIAWKIARKLPPEHQYIGRPLHQIFKVVLFIPTAIGFFWWWGIDVSHLVISAGLIGGVLLFILRTPLENTMSAFFLIMQYRLKYNQEISIRSLGTVYSGKLIYLDLGHIFLQGDTGSVYVIPNGTVNASILELKAEDTKDLTSAFFLRGQREEQIIEEIEQKEENIVKDIEKI